MSIAAAGNAAAAGGPSDAILSLSFQDRFASNNPATQNDWDQFREGWQGGGEALTLNEGMKWSDDGTPIKNEEDTNAVRIFPHATITLSGRTKRNVIAGKDVILNTIGKVNEGNLTIKGFVYSDNTVLFEGCDMNEENDTASGSDVTALSFKFAVQKDHTWNQFWDKETQTFRTLIGATTDEPPYSDTIFSDLNPIYWT